MSTTSVSRSRVVPGTSVTIARPRRRAVEQARLAGVRPADDRDLRSPRGSSGRAPRREQRVDRAAIDVASCRDGIVGVDEVIALFREIERRLEPARQIEQRASIAADPRRSASLRADRRRRAPAAASPRRSDRATASACTRSMRPLQVRAQRELARLGQPRAGVHRGARRSPSSTGLPCAQISTTSSPV